MNHQFKAQSHIAIPTSSKLEAREIIVEVGIGEGMKYRTAPAVGLLTHPSDTPGPRDDEQLVCAAQAGCQAAFEELFRLYSRRVHRTVLAITRNSEDAEDAMQESFLRAFQAVGRFEGRASFYSWLTRIAINSALIVLRRRRKRQEISFSSSQDWGCEILPMDFADSAPDPEEACSQQQRRALLVSAIHSLKPCLREAVRAHVEEECSIKEIAKKCNISEAAAKSRLLRARVGLGRLCANTYGSRIRRESLRAS